MGQTMVTTGTAGALGSTAAELINQLHPEFLRVAQYKNQLEQLYEPYRIQNAKVMQWNRMERDSVATTPSQLTEGVNPPAVGLRINSVTATVEEYGKVYKFSRLAAMTAKHPVVQQALRTAGLAASETRARLLYNIADAATNVFRVNDRATDNALEVGDTASMNEVAQMGGTLGTAGTMEWESGRFRMVVPPFVGVSITTDNNWLSAHQFNNTDNILRGYEGTIQGADIIRTNDNSFVSTASTTSGNASKIYSSFIAGRGWAGVTDLESTRLIMKGPGSGDDDLDLLYKLGFYMCLKAVILDQDFGLRVRSAGADATAVA